jgi:hypothetical protein
MLEKVRSELSTRAGELVQSCKINVAGDQRYHTEFVSDVHIISALETRRREMEILRNTKVNTYG